VTPEESGELEKQLHDVAGIVDVRPDLDRSYVARWAEELGVSRLGPLAAGPRRSPVTKTLPQERARSSVETEPDRAEDDSLR
jgi:hypothetical protein